MGQGMEPEQIARRLLMDFPGEKTMRISHEASIGLSSFRAAVYCAAS